MLAPVLTALEQRLIERIQQHGPLRMAEYMHACLFDPDDGYYTTRASIGVAGDFITAPELTPLFGEVLAGWVFKQWQTLGAPTAFNLVECGAGNGTLMHDMLTALSAQQPDCAAALNGIVMDVSPSLINLQKQTLKNMKLPLQWVGQLSEINFDLPTVFIGNEVLDCFPINQYEQKDGAWLERKIGLNNNGLCIIAEVTHKVFPSEFSVVETHSAAHEFLMALKKSLRKGAALLIDYGAAGGEKGDSLQALYRHTKVDILHQPGRADLTSHVDFLAAQELLGSAACTLHDLAFFLLDNGFASYAVTALESAADATARARIESASQRLLSPNEMGKLFKVLEYRVK